MTTVKVTSADRTLYHVAATQLGDATQWWRIAQMNGLSDPSLGPFTTPVLLQLPLVDGTLTDGIPSE